MKEFDIVFNSAQECKTNTINSIYNRLISWRNCSTTDNDDGWLSNTQAILRCIRSINRTFKTAFMKEYNLIDWACGLCQMLDSTDEDICELLPFLLTAYIFNFPDNQFVSCFISKEYAQEFPKALLYAASYEGVDEYDFPDESVIGIGRLILRQMPKDNIHKQELLRLANRFDFPEIRPIRLRDDYVPAIDDYFVPPTRHQGQIKREIKRVHLGEQRELDIVVGRSVLEIPPAGHIIYEKNFVKFLFATLFFIISKQKKIHSKDFACSPDLLKSWILLADALHDTDELDVLNNYLATEKQDGATTLIQDRLKTIVE